MNFKKKVFAIIFIAGLVSSVSLYLAYAGFQLVKENQQKQSLLEKRRVAWQMLKEDLESKAQAFRGDAGIIIVDLNTGWRYSLNKDKLFPSASIVKIPIMAACFQAAYEGKLNLREQMVLRLSNKTPGSGLLKNYASGTAIPVEKLIEIMITQSDNTAANMLIERLGFDYLNAYFKKSGLEHTNLSRKMMDFKFRKHGVENYTCANDISSLLEKIYHRKFLSRQVSEKCLNMLLRQKVNDRIPKKLPDDCPVAHKTGLEKNVCHDAGIVFTQQGDFLICVLTKSNCGTRQVKEFISNLALEIYQTYRRFPYPRYSLLKEQLRRRKAYVRSG
jgi:beta-lactamase class A